MDVDDADFLQELSRVQANLDARLANLATLRGQEAALKRELAALDDKVTEARFTRSRTETTLYAAKMAHSAHMHVVQQTQLDMTQMQAKGRAFRAKQDWCRTLLATSEPQCPSVSPDERLVRFLLPLLSGSELYGGLVSAATKDGDHAQMTEAVVAACLENRRTHQNC